MVPPEKRAPRRQTWAKAKTPAERADEYSAIQRRLKQEAAERREAAAKREPEAKRGERPGRRTP
jgi:hypothetical protein